MIGFDNLGRLGRLGNQMFQYAGLRGIAAHRGYEFAIPPSEFKNKWTDHQLFEAFKLSGLRHINVISGTCVQEKHFAFDEELFNNMPDGQNVYGYLQTEKYFRHIESEIRWDFRFKDEVYGPCREMMEAIENPIALHVRRGDYLTNVENHPPCSRDYYNEAIKRFDAGRPIMVFSDDPDWCRKQFTDNRFLISEGYDDLAELCMMSLCDDFIIANSSFSWWGSWLSENKEKTIIAPSRWFGCGYTSANDTSDLYCENWTVIDT